MTPADPDVLVSPLATAPPPRQAQPGTAGTPHQPAPAGTPGQRPDQRGQAQRGLPGQQGSPQASRRAQPSRPPRPEPSWATVLATTLRLWTQRRLRSTRWHLWPGSAGGRAALVTVLVAAVFAAGAATMVLARGGSPGSQAAAGHRAPGQAPAGQAPAGQAPAGQAPAGTAALAAAAAARQAAAAWVVGQVSPEAIVACDPAMCGALQAAAVPAARLLVLGPGRADPLGSDLVVATPVLRSQFGARLVSVYAPVTLAGFGAGSARIDVRVVAPDGAAAYRAALAADVQARRSAGVQLLRNPRIHLTAAASDDLVGGDVDSRLLVTLAALAAQHPVEVIGFGSASHGASAGVPLRSAEIGGARARGAKHPVSLRSLRTFLRAQRPPYRPTAITTVKLTPRRTVLRIVYRVPSPLGLLGPRS
jgi:hypothetical protein